MDHEEELADVKRRRPPSIAAAYRASLVRQWLEEGEDLNARAERLIAASLAEYERMRRCASVGKI